MMAKPPIATLPVESTKIKNSKKKCNNEKNTDRLSLFLGSLGIRFPNANLKILLEGIFLSRMANPKSKRGHLIVWIDSNNGDC